MDEQTGTEAELIATCLRAMSRDPALVRGWSRLTGGASGSGVYQLTLEGDQELVLKVTTTDEWRARSRRELRVYEELAGRLPLRTPRELGMADSAGVTALLLSAGRPAPPPATWSTARWVELASQLGALHHPTVAAAAKEMPWLGRQTWAAKPSDAAVGSALGYWRTATGEPVVRSLLASSTRLTTTLEALPMCLVHGDCHADNLLVDETDRWIWTDWQEVGFGHGPGDLAMLWQRAEFDGAQPPRSEMLEAYARARGLSHDQSLPRAVAAAELLLLLFGWPEHLARADQGQQDIMTGRLQQLAAEWAAGGRWTM